MNWNFKYLFIIAVWLIIPSGFALAQTGFTPLVKIPGVTDNEGGISGYLNAIYRLSISVAALLAVLILIKAGVKYMFSDIVTYKSDAKNDIRGAILGLLLIISAVLILSTINEDLTNFQIMITPIEFIPTDDQIRSEYCEEREGCVTITCNDENCRDFCRAEDGVVLPSGNCVMEEEKLRNCDLQANKSCCTMNGYNIIHEDENNFVCGATGIRKEFCLNREMCIENEEICTRNGGNVLATTTEYVICDRSNTTVTTNEINNLCPYEDKNYCSGISYSQLQNLTNCWFPWTCRTACQNRKGIYAESSGVCVQTIPINSSEPMACGGSSPITCEDAEEQCEAWGLEFNLENNTFTCQNNSIENPELTNAEILNQVLAQISDDDDFLEAIITDQNELDRLETTLGEIIIAFTELPFVNNLDEILRDTCGSDSYFSSVGLSGEIIIGCRAK